MYALIVDPSKTYRTLLSSVLEGYGFGVMSAPDSALALTLVAKNRYDLICVSIEGSSNELFSLIRGSGLNKNTPIVMLTSNYSREVIEKSIAAGVTHVFQKKAFSVFSNYLGQFCKELLFADVVTGKILYVEDSLSVAAATVQLLTSTGHQVEHCTFAEDAIDKFLASEYDLVLTDLLLAGEAGGLDIVRSIRSCADGNKKNVPVLAVSAFEDSARRIELFRSGINDYVQKPIIHEELLARINNLIRTQRLLKQLNLQHERLKEVAMTDQLTTLYNRHYLMEELPKKISQANRYDQSLSLLMLDIDYFKLVNDKYGHQMGDEILIVVANTLKQCCRNEDLVVRYGGEEFIVLLDRCNLNDARERSEFIRKAIESLKPYDINVTVSLGVSTYKNGSDSYEGLFSRADKAVYEAKNLGRNIVVVES